jgi:hypothetical protein
MHIIKATLGHADYRTALRYVREDDEAKRAAAEVLGLIGEAPEDRSAGSESAAGEKSGSRGVARCLRRGGLNPWAAGVPAVGLEPTTRGL